MQSATLEPVTLADHKRIEMSLLTDLERLRDYAAKLELSKSVELLQEVSDRLKSSHFSIAVVGEFKRGKSTFINALLGQDILPSDLLPCSATLNRVTYGIQPGVRITFKDGRVEDVPIDQMTNYVTKLDPESEELAATVKEAVVSYPVPYCQNNVDLIDTPGLNDDANMTDVTLSVLPEVDAAILVVMALSPFSEYERDFLENKLLTADLGRVLFVVSAIDRLNTPEDADKVIKAVRDRIKKYVIKRAQEQFGAGSAEFEAYMMKVGEPRVFGLSAYQALQARAKADTEMLAKSRFPEFEQALEKFLAQERGAVVLQIPLSRAQNTALEILRTLDVREAALSMKSEEFKPAYEKAVAEIAQLRQRKIEEENKIDASSERLRREILPLVGQLGPKVEQAVRDTVEAFPVNPNDLGGQTMKNTADKLAKKVTEAIRSTSQKHGELLQMQVQEGLASEAGRLDEFVQTMHSSVQNIQHRFSGDNSRDSLSSSDAVCAGLVLFTGLGGLWSGYREGGVKGAAVGSAVSIGTFLGGGMILGALGIAVSLPITLGLLGISYALGGRVTRAMFAEQQVKDFKAKFIEQALADLNSKLNTREVEAQVTEYIRDTFTALKTKVQSETSALLDDTEKTLMDINLKRDRAEALSEEERKDLQEIRERTRVIAGNAQQLLERLAALNPAQASA